MGSGGSLPPRVSEASSKTSVSAKGGYIAGPINEKQVTCIYWVAYNDRGRDWRGPAPSRLSFAFWASSVGGSMTFISLVFDSLRIGVCVFYDGIVPPSILGRPATSIDVISNFAVKP